MNFDPAILSRLSFKVLNSIQENYKGNLLPGGKTLTATGANGTLIIQEINEPLYSLQYNVYDFSEQTKLYSIEKPAMLHASLALRNGAMYSIKGIGQIKLMEGQCAMFHAPTKKANLIFQEGIESHFFDLYYSRELLKEFLPFFPKVETLFSKASSNKAFLFGSHNKWADPKIKDIAFELIHCSYNEKIRAFYFENKIRECLFVMLVHAFEKAPENIQISKDEEEKIHYIRSMLAESVNRHYTIPELSRMVGMNAFKLKLAFRREFGKGMFEYQKEERLKEARRLLLDSNKPPKEIARLTGYHRITSFITEFRKHFGYTPGSVRRK